MTRLLYITPPPGPAPLGGRASLSQLHLKCLRALLGDALVVHELDAAPAPLASRLRGYIDGVTPAAVDEILGIVAAEGIARVFLNGSNLGRLAARIKRAVPAVELITFFHNVEARFFLGGLKARKSPRALAVLVANHIAERAAVRCSDRLLTLSARDSDQLARLYGRGGTDLLPMAIEDKLDGTPPDGAFGPGEGYLLFVGGAFYANRDGILWFAREVAPHIGMTTRVVGHGLESLAGRIGGGGRVELVGAVDRLDPHYRGAKAVIAPIFDGSGMKTKVAEALMFGKKVIGTREAFSGYEALAGTAGWTCRDRQEFVAAIGAVEHMSLPRFDAGLRQAFELGHSERAMLERLAGITGGSVARGTAARVA